jgi:hypothetical protein
MTKTQSFLNEAVEMLRDLEEFKRPGSKDAFKKQLGEEYVRRLGAASLDEALAAAVSSLVTLHQTLGVRGPLRKRLARSPKPRKPAGA